LFCSISNLCIAHSCTDSPFTSFATTTLQSIEKSAPLKDPASSILKCNLFSISRHDQFQCLPTKKSPGVLMKSWQYFSTIQFYTTNRTTQTPLPKVVTSEISIPVATLSPYFGIQLPYSLFVLYLHNDWIHVLVSQKYYPFYDNF
jgi:hypothetical protein